MLSKVFQVSRNYNEHMKRNGLKRHPPSVYDIHDTVLVRVRHPKKKPRMNYLKKDITSLTRSEEIKHRKMDPNLINKQADKSKYNIPLSRGEWVYRYGFTVIFDPLPNGDCQFSAIADQLKHIGIHRSPASLRQEVVNDLRTRPYLVDGTSLENFFGQNNLEAYLKSMSRRGTHGDHITVAEIFNVQFIIFSSIGPHGTRIIYPSGVYDDDIPTLFLAHDSEDEGEHYYSIQGDASSRATALSIFDTSNRITLQQGVGRRNSKRSNEGSCQNEGDLDGRDYPGSDGRRKERVDDVGCRNGEVVCIGEKDRGGESEDNVISANQEGGEAHGTDQDGGEKDGIDQEESEIDDTDKKSGKKNGIDKSVGELSAGEYSNEIDGKDTGGGSVSSRDQNKCSKSWSDDGGGDVGDRNGGNQSGRNGEGIEVGEIDVEKGEVSGEMTVKLIWMRNSRQRAVQQMTKKEMLMEDIHCPSAL
ncbi:hypothetical protein KUTeg_014168 [Tegillarca granosa]|uniref:OTU domain-containing protein n=1 Tax=Tegillarca granosa TaxID=220873 RepID=A0ABQ9EVU1_TEGGR|nr:hypothetical protein KUTeg_014168 [Tegillarca granosa]